MVAAQISPDLVEWLAADQKVCAKWRSLGRRLGLGPHLALIPGSWAPTPGARRRTQSERQCLLGLLRLWQDKRPETFNLKTLKWVLAAEGLHDMWMWINMMTQESPLKTEMAAAVYSRISSPTSPSPCSPTSSSSPWSSHLYTPAPSSPYSAFFRPTPSPSSTYQDYSAFPSLSSSPASSRPPSRSSVNSDLPCTRPASQGSDMRTSGARQGATSCPTTPLSSRRGEWSTLNSPGAVRGPSSPYWSTSALSSPSPQRRGVYELLYRPDLIKLSSPTNWVREKRQESGRTRYHSGGASSLGGGSYSGGRRRYLSEDSEGGCRTPPCPPVRGQSMERDGEDRWRTRRSEEREGVRLHLQEPSGLAGAGKELQEACDSLLEECRRQEEPAASQGKEQLGRQKLQEMTQRQESMPTRTNYIQGQVRRQELQEQTRMMEPSRKKEYKEHVSRQETITRRKTNVAPVTQPAAPQSPGSVRTQLQISVVDKRPFAVKKVRAVHLDEMPAEPPIRMPSPKRGSNNTYSEYFDNLLSLIDKAAKDLSL